MLQRNTYGSKGAHGREGSVGSLVAVCKARCGLAVEDTSKFVEFHNILQKVLACFGILFLGSILRIMDDVLFFASSNDSVSMTRFQASLSCAAPMKNIFLF